MRSKDQTAGEYETSHLPALPDLPRAEAAAIAAGAFRTILMGKFSVMRSLVCRTMTTLISNSDAARWARKQLDAEYHYGQVSVRWRMAANIREFAGSSTLYM